MYEIIIYIFELRIKIELYEDHRSERVFAVNVVFAFCSTFFFIPVTLLSYFALRGSPTFLLCMALVLISSPWNSYFCALYGSRTLLLC